MAETVPPEGCRSGWCCRRWGNPLWYGCPQAAWNTQSPLVKIKNQRSGSREQLVKDVHSILFTETDNQLLLIQVLKKWFTEVLQVSCLHCTVRHIQHKQVDGRLGGSQLDIQQGDRKVLPNMFKSLFVCLFVITHIWCCGNNTLLPSGGHKRILHVTCGAFYHVVWGSDELHRGILDFWSLVRFTVWPCHWIVHKLIWY